MLLLLLLTLVTPAARALLIARMVLVDGRGRGLAILSYVFGKVWKLLPGLP